MLNNTDDYCLFQNLNKMVANLKVVQFLWPLLYIFAYVYYYEHVHKRINMLYRVSHPGIQNISKLFLLCTSSSTFGINEDISC